MKPSLLSKLKAASKENKEKEEENEEEEVGLKVPDALPMPSRASKSSSVGLLVQKPAQKQRTLDMLLFGGGKKKRGSSKPAPLQHSATPQWEYDLRLPGPIGSLADGDHFFPFGEIWLLNVSVDCGAVGFYLHTTDKERRVTARFKVGTGTYGLHNDGRTVSPHPDEGWGFVIPVHPVRHVFKVLVSADDLSRGKSRKEPSAPQHLSTPSDDKRSSDRGSQGGCTPGSSPQRSARRDPLSRFD